MKGKEFVAYAGNYFTIEWYFNDKGESQALDSLFLYSLIDSIAEIVCLKRYKSISIK